MRRTYISPEFIYNPVDGSFNMKEESSFFGSKMMDIDDEIFIGPQSIVYYQNANNEQLDFAVEKTLPQVIYSGPDDKDGNSELIINPVQSDRNTKWILKINLKSILRNYIFAKIKNSRSFELIENNKTKFDNVDLAIEEYIDQNILDKYTLSELTLFIDYKALSDDNDTFELENTWNVDANDIINIESKVQSSLKFDESLTTIRFNQKEISTEFNFDYYYDLKFIKKVGGDVVRDFVDISGRDQFLIDNTVAEYDRMQKELTALNRWLVRPHINRREVSRMDRVSGVTAKTRGDIQKVINKNLVNTKLGKEPNGKEKLNDSCLQQIKRYRVPTTVSTKITEQDLAEVFDLKSLDAISKGCD